MRFVHSNWEFATTFTSLKAITIDRKRKKRFFTFDSLIRWWRYDPFLWSPPPSDLRTSLSIHNNLYTLCVWWRYCEDPTFERHLHDLLLLECLKECLKLSDRDNYLASDDIEALYVLYDLGKNCGIYRALDLLSHRYVNILFVSILLY